MFYSEEEYSLKHQIETRKPVASIHYWFGQGPGFGSFCDFREGSLVS